MKLVLFGFFSFFSFAVFANTPVDSLSFEDNAFKDCIKSVASERKWQYVEQFSDIKCHGMGIEKAQEVNQFINLHSLSLFNNNLQSLDLTNLSKLKLLNLANNQLHALEISSLNRLEKLYLFKNQLETLDMSGLSSLQAVRMMQNQLKTLDISALKNLKMGYFFDNKLVDLQISGLDKLEFLDVRQNPMPDELYDFYDEQDGVVISHDGNADDWK